MMKRAGFFLCTMSVMALLAGFLIGCGAQNMSGEEETVPAVCEETIAVRQETVPSEQEESNGREKILEADIALYGCSPVTEELSKIPAMENRLYAAWEGRIYYRQYSDEDMEDGALWADFSPVADTGKELMCMEPDGNVTQVGVDYGCDAMFIVHDRLFSQKYVLQEHGGYTTGRYRVYSSRLDGSDVREYDAETVLAVKGERVICQMKEGGLLFLDAQNGQEHILLEKSVTYLDADEEGIFCYYYLKSAKERYDVALCFLDYEGNMQELKRITFEEYADCMTDMNVDVQMFETQIDIPCFWIQGDELYFSAGTYNGTAKAYTGGPIYSMKRDGRSCKIEAVSYEQFFYLYDDGINRSLFYRMPDAGTAHKTKYNGEYVGIEQICLYGEEQELVLRMPYQPFDKPYVHSPVDLEQGPQGDSILLYPDTSGSCYVLLTGLESEKLGIRTHVDGHIVQNLHGIEYLNGKLFFTVTDLTYSEAHSLGWRDGYERGRSACYCKDLNSGEIRMLYEY